MKGGFLSPEKPDQFTQNQGGKAGNTERKGNLTTITPTTIKYLNDCLRNSTEGSFTMDGMALDHIAICGRVLKIQEESTRIIIEIDDTTGVLEFFIYNRSKNELPHFYQNSNLKENSYIKAILIVTNYQDKKLFVCNFLSEIKSYNEISAHIFAVIQTHLHRTRGFLKSHDESNKENAANSGDFKPTFKKSDITIDAKMRSILEKQNSLSEKVNEICMALAEKQERPITVDDLVKVTKSKYEESTLLGELKKLVQNGFLYSSGNGYKVLD